MHFAKFASRLVNILSANWQIWRIQNLFWKHIQSTVQYHFVGDCCHGHQVWIDIVGKHCSCYGYQMSSVAMATKWPKWLQPIECKQCCCLGHQMTTA
jgi:hypothetical protein